MKNLVTFPAVYSLDFGIVGKNAQTSDQKYCDLSELPDFHSLDIVSFGPYVLISDEELIWVFELSEIQSLEIRIYFYELPEVHSMKTEFVVPYELISDEELDYFYELAEITVWTCLMFTLCTLDFLAFMQRCLMKKGNPYKLPDIHTLDIMNCLFMQLEMCLNLGGWGGGFFFGILFCT